MFVSEMQDSRCRSAGAMSAISGHDMLHSCHPISKDSRLINLPGEEEVNGYDVYLIEYAKNEGS